MFLIKSEMESYQRISYKFIGKVVRPICALLLLLCLYYWEVPFGLLDR